MFQFGQYHEPETLTKARTLLLNNPSAQIVAGGTDLLLKIKHGKYQNIDLISLNNIGGLKDITQAKDGKISIGCMVPFNQIIDDRIILKYLPVIKEVAESIGGHQIRNMATMVGNICNGAPCSDSAPILMVHDACLVIEGEAGIKKNLLEQFYMGPFQVNLQRGDIVLALEIPVVEEHDKGSHYIKYSMRRAMDIATLGCAASVILEDYNTIKNIKLAFGTAAPKPIRCRRTEQNANKIPITDEFLSTLGQSASEEASPRGSWRASKDLRNHLIKELTKKTIMMAVNKARSRFDEKNN